MGFGQMKLQLGPDWRGSDKGTVYFFSVLSILVGLNPPSKKKRLISWHQLLGDLDKVPERFENFSPRSPRQVVIRALHAAQLRSHLQVEKALDTARGRMESKSPVHSSLPELMGQNKSKLLFCHQTFVLTLFFLNSNSTLFALSKENSTNGAATKTKQFHGSFPLQAAISR